MLEVYGGGRNIWALVSLLYVVYYMFKPFIDINLDSCWSINCFILVFLIYISSEGYSFPVIGGWLVYFCPCMCTTFFSTKLDNLLRPLMFDGISAVYEVKTSPLILSGVYITFMKHLHAYVAHMNNYIHVIIILLFFISNSVIIDHINNDSNHIDHHLI